MPSRAGGAAQREASPDIAECCDVRSPLFRLRISPYLLTGRGRGELVDRALRAIALTIAPHRGYRVVIGRLRRQTVDAHPENRLRMAAVEPDVGFGRPAQVFGIRPKIYDGEMVVVASRVGAGPSDNGQVVAREFQLWSVDDCAREGRAAWMSSGSSTYSA
jgi:hypothetical protein